MKMIVSVKVVYVQLDKRTSVVGVGDERVTLVSSRWSEMVALTNLVEAITTIIRSL